MHPEHSIGIVSLRWQLCKHCWLVLVVLIFCHTDIGRPRALPPRIATQHRTKPSRMVSFLQKMDTRRLDGRDMKRLVRILRNVPGPTDEQAHYRKFIKQIIQDLPRRLRSPTLTFGSPSNLCYIHKGLNAHLINDIWAWLKHEFEGALGMFLYPLIMHNLLTADQEWKLRQLEPVLQMWQRDFSPDTSRPPGHEPIYAADKWFYQQNQCPACIMARIGSEQDVLFALFAGMVCRYNIKQSTYEDAIRGHAAWSRTSSKRIRFVKYWLRNTHGGDNIVFEAGELGMLMKRLRRHYHSLSGTAAQNTPVTAGYRPGEAYSTPVVVDENQAYEYYLSTLDTPASYQTSGLEFPAPPDPKIGPNPRPSDAEPLSPAEPLGFERLGVSYRRSMPRNMQDGPLSSKSSSTTLSLIYSAYSDDISSPSHSTSPATPTHSTPFRIPRKPVPVGCSSSSTHEATKAKSLQPKPGKSATYNPHQDSSVNTLHGTYPPAPTRTPPPPPPLPPTRSPPPPPPPSLSLPQTHPPRAIPSSIYSRPPSPALTCTTKTPTIMSYTGGPSARAHHRDPFDNPIYASLETREERVQRYRRLLAPRPEGRDDDGSGSGSRFTDYILSEDDTDQRDQQSHATTSLPPKEQTETPLPPPQRKSIYAAWRNPHFNTAEFDGVDAALGQDERNELEAVIAGEIAEEANEGSDVGDGRSKGKGRARGNSVASTVWRDLY